MKSSTKTKDKLLSRLERPEGLLDSVIPPSDTISGVNSGVLSLPPFANVQFDQALLLQGISNHFLQEPIICNDLEFRVQEQEHHRISQNGWNRFLEGCK